MELNKQDISFKGENKMSSVITLPRTNLANDIERQIRKLEETKKIDLPAIKSPDRKIFPRFPEMQNKVFNKLPQFALIKLENKPLNNISIRVGNDLCTASVPIIPRTALEAAKRVMDQYKDQGTEFHLAFIPQWEKQRLVDPVLVVKINRHWFKVAQWDDYSKINEYLV